eukprot:SAG31_NODE_29601_length_392_cov_1.450512_1_plen_56_part_10
MTRHIRIINYGRTRACTLERAVHSTVCGTIQLTTKCTTSKFYYFEVPILPLNLVSF